MIKLFTSDAAKGFFGFNSDRLILKEYLTPGLKQA